MQSYTAFLYRERPPKELYVNEEKLISSLSKEPKAFLSLENHVDGMLGAEALLNGTACTLVAGGDENMAHFILSLRPVYFASPGTLRNDPSRRKMDDPHAGKGSFRTADVSTNRASDSMATVGGYWKKAEQRDSTNVTYGFTKSFFCAPGIPLGDPTRIPVVLAKMLLR
jgi:hypothetical protein